MMVLEYPMKILLYIVVVLVIIGIIFTFRNQILEIKLFPNNNKDCDVESIVATEDFFNQNIMDKYCRLCWNKNNMGECKQNAVCYFLSTTFVVEQHASLEPSDDFCELDCYRDATALFVSYDSFHKKITITC